MVTILLTLLGFLVLLIAAVFFAVRARALAYDKHFRDQIRLQRRLENREAKLKIKARKHRRNLAKKRLARMKRAKALAARAK
jgi:hypothetical protein